MESKVSMFFLASQLSLMQYATTTLQLVLLRKYACPFYRFFFSSFCRPSPSSLQRAITLPTS